MDVSEYFTSISLELYALKNRVRNFVAHNHWQTDGEWKESVLRSILRRHLPDSVKVGRGFIVTPEGCSSQIDVLIYDASKPILYRDGELVFITSDAVKGIIEVKSTVRTVELREILSKLAANAEFAYRHSSTLRPRNGLYVGLFAYDTYMNQKHSGRVLLELRRAARGSESRIVNHLSLGDSLFVRFWDRSPSGEDGYDRWHSYYLGSKSAGYFVNNVMHMIAEESVDINQDVWFPVDGKENYLIGDVPLRGGNGLRPMLVTTPPYAE
jgi:hypothetical protein